MHLKKIQNSFAGFSFIAHYSYNIEDIKTFRNNNIETRIGAAMRYR